MKILDGLPESVDRRLALQGHRVSRNWKKYLIACAMVRTRFSHILKEVLERSRLLAFLLHTSLQLHLGR